MQRRGPLHLAALLLGICLGGSSGANAQVLADPGFPSVGRGAPLHQALPPTGSPWGQRLSAQAYQAYVQHLRDYPFVGALHMPLGRNSPVGAALPDLQVITAQNGAAPAGITPLPIDLFTSKDFYKDRALWGDKRYWRCNSPQSIEALHGALMPLFVALDGAESPRTAAWGRCDRDYPRKAIVSPYRFTTAQAHYEALQRESVTRGASRRAAAATSDRSALPTDWSGRYATADGMENWYGMMLANQVPTILSLLTPEYQQRLVQELYHQGHSNAPQWLAQYCWPEGFMRRWYYLATLGQPHFVLATPDFVQIRAGVAGNFLTDIHIGRQFNLEGVPCRAWVPMSRAGMANRWVSGTVTCSSAGPRTSRAGRPMGPSSSRAGCRRWRSIHRPAMPQGRSRV